MKHNQDEFAQLFPTLEGEDLEEARENFDRYLTTVFRIHERIRRDPEAQRRLHALTDSRDHDTIQSRSNPSLISHSK